MNKPLLIKILLTLLLSQYSLAAIAQTLSTPKPTSNESIDVFGASQKKVADNGYVKNIIKVNPTLLFNGELPILYERMLSKKISVEVGLGITKENYFEVTKFIKNYNTDEVNVDYKAQMGYAIHAAFRFYPFSDDDAPDGLYLGSEILYRVYNKLSPYHDATTGNVIEGQNANTYTKSFNVRFMMGKQFVFDNNITYEYYMGLGLESRTFNYLQAGDSYNSSGLIYHNELKTDTQVIPIFALGFKLGFGF
jgi:hypothetical protein